MDLFTTFIEIAFAVLMVCVAIYVYITNGIIKEQDKKIAKLRTDNFRLQAALRGKRYVKNVEYFDEELHNPQAKIIEIYDNRIAPENVPDFEFLRRE